MESERNKISERLKQLKKEFLKKKKKLEKCKRTAEAKAYVKAVLESINGTDSYKKEQLIDAGVQNADGTTCIVHEESSRQGALNTDMSLSTQCIPDGQEISATLCNVSSENSNELCQEKFTEMILSGDHKIVPDTAITSTSKYQTKNFISSEAVVLKSVSAYSNVSRSEIDQFCAKFSSDNTCVYKDILYSDPLSNGKKIESVENICSFDAQKHGQSSHFAESTKIDQGQILERNLEKMYQESVCGQQILNANTNISSCQNGTYDKHKTSVKCDFKNGCFDDSSQNQLPVQKNQETSSLDIVPDVPCAISLLDKLTDTQAICVCNSLTDISTVSVTDSLTNCDSMNHLKLQRSNRTQKRSLARKRLSPSVGVPRHSPRLAEHYSQENSLLSSLAESHYPVFVSSHVSTTKQMVVVISIFQCLIDEAKRNNQIEDFNIPLEYINYSSLYDSEISNKTRTAAETIATSKPIATEAETTSAEKITAAEIIATTETAKQISRNCSKDLKYLIANNQNELDRNNGEVIKEIDSETFASSACVLHVKSSDNVKLDVSSSVDMTSHNLFASQNAIFNFEHDEEHCQISADVNSKVGTDCHNIEEPLTFTNGSMSVDDASLTGNYNENKLKIDYVEISQGNTLHSNEIHDANEDALLNDESCVLQETWTFTVPESLLTMACIETCTSGDGNPILYVLCVCATSLYIFSENNGVWVLVAMQKLKINIRKKYNEVLHVLQHASDVRFVLLDTRSNTSNVIAYRLRGTSIQHSDIDSIDAQSVQVSPLSGSELLVYYMLGSRTLLRKYSQDKVMEMWSYTQLDSTLERLTAVMSLQGIDAAVAALTTSKKLLIWNHQSGHLLCSVDISDVCPVDPVCLTVFSQQGYLFAPMLTRKKCTDPGCVVVVNPYIGSSETLVSIQPCQMPWTGCVEASMMADKLMLSRETSGHIHIWNVFTGHHLATIDHVSITCITSSNLWLAVAHKQCVHVYHLKEPM